MHGFHGVCQTPRGSCYATINDELLQSLHSPNVLHCSRKYLLSSLLINSCICRSNMPLGEHPGGLTRKWSCLNKVQQIIITHLSMAFPRQYGVGGAGCSKHGGLSPMCCIDCIVTYKSCLNILSVHQNPGNISIMTWHECSHSEHYVIFTASMHLHTPYECQAQGGCVRKQQPPSGSNRFWTYTQRMAVHARSEPSSE